MSDRIKVVRVIARLNVGGPARHVSWLTAALNDDAFESLLVCGSIPPGEDDMSGFAAGLNVQPLVIGEMSRAISPRDLVVAWKLLRLLWRYRPDILHTHTAKAGTVGRVAALLYRLTGRRPLSVVHTFHGHVFHGYYGPVLSSLFVLIERSLARVTDRIIVLSRAQLEEIRDRYRIGRAEQFAIVPLGLDLEALTAASASSLRKELGIESGEFVAGIVGRLTEVKQHELFLDGVAAWTGTNGGAAATFLVIGNGHRRRALETRTAELGLTDRIRFLGNREDPAAFYAALDVVVLTSRNEGTPLSLIEAMAAGVPVMSTPVGGVVDLLGSVLHGVGTGVKVHERGVSFEADAESFSRALGLLRGDAALRAELVARARSHVVSVYSRERLVGDIRALYKTLTPR